MVKARIGSICLLGLSALNIQKLMEGQPILFDAKVFGPEFKDVKIAIHYGRTEQAIVDDLELQMRAKS